MSEDFGKRVKKARKKAGYTQSQLAEMVDVSVNHISAIERGVYETRIGTLKKLSIVLGASTDYLMNRDRSRKHFQRQTDCLRMIRHGLPTILKQF